MRGNTIVKTVQLLFWTGLSALVTVGNVPNASSLIVSLPVKMVS